MPRLARRPQPPKVQPPKHLLAAARSGATAGSSKRGPDPVAKAHASEGASQPRRLSMPPPMPPPMHLLAAAAKHAASDLAHPSWYSSISSEITAAQPPVHEALAGEEEPADWTEAPEALEEPTESRPHGDIASDSDSDWGGWAAAKAPADIPAVLHSHPSGDNDVWADLHRGEFRDWSLEGADRGTHPRKRRLGHWQTKRGGHCMVQRTAPVAEFCGSSSVTRRGPDSQFLL